ACRTARPPMSTTPTRRTRWSACSSHCVRTPPAGCTWCSVPVATATGASIRAAILAACPGAIEIGDRARAIEAALGELGPGDVLAVAGKGHEQGQTIGGVVVPFDDVGVVRK